MSKTESVTAPEEEKEKLEYKVKLLEHCLLLYFRRENYFDAAKKLLEVFEPPLMSDEEIKAFQTAIVYCQKRGVECNTEAKEKIPCQTN